MNILKHFPVHSKFTNDNHPYIACKLCEELDEISLELDENNYKNLIKELLDVCQLAVTISAKNHTNIKIENNNKYQYDHLHKLKEHYLGYVLKEVSFNLDKFSNNLFNCAWSLINKLIKNDKDLKEKLLHHNIKIDIYTDQPYIAKKLKEDYMVLKELLRNYKNIADKRKVEARMDQIIIEIAGDKNERNL